MIFSFEVWNETGLGKSWIIWVKMEPYLILEMKIKFFFFKHCLQYRYNHKFIFIIQHRFSTYKSPYIKIPPKTVQVRRHKFCENPLGKIECLSNTGVSRIPILNIYLIIFQLLEVLAYRKGKRVISSDSKFNPNFVPTMLKIFNVVTIEAMERKVHIQEVGVNK